MLTRRKRHIPRKMRPHNRNSSVPPTSGAQRGSFQPPTEISTNSWTPNKSPSATQPDKKTTGCMKNGRVWCASCLAILLRLLSSFLVRVRTLQRSIHLLDREILRVDSVLVDEEIVIRMRLFPYLSFLLYRRMVSD